MMCPLNDNCSCHETGDVSVVLTLARLAGITMTAQQEELLGVLFARGSDGNLASFEVRCDDNTVITAAVLSWMYLDGLDVLWAVPAVTAASLSGRISQLITSSPELNREVRFVRRLRGAEETELRSGARLRFRSPVSMHGSRVHRLITSERFLPQTLPLLAGLANPQVVITR